MAYCYPGCGLDNVWLANGYTLHESDVSIEDIVGLHQAIGRALIAQPRLLNGAKVRFLRTEMGMTPPTLARLLGTDPRPDQPVVGPTDRLLRVLYAEFLGDKVHVRQMLERLAAPYRVEGDGMLFTRTHEWELSWIN